ncbi:hypothetical protein PQR52_29700 [Paraburkholderia aspalathi]|uniref:hypothetical protein n=1 Tax=Paraburkholderia aspalathi TaxID=1324617 RepID=UPI0038BC9360
MNIYKVRLSVSLPWAITLFAGAWIFIFVGASFLFTDKTWFGKEGILWLFAVGAVPGLVVALAQFGLSWVEFNEISRIKRLAVKGVLRTRDDPAYYGKCIEKAERHIVFVGGTGRRFFQDFADVNYPTDEKKKLITALERGVHVKILVPTETHLSDKQLEGIRSAKQRCDELRRTFPRQFEAKVFDHPASYALVWIDHEVIVGPVFANMESKNTPVIHLASHNALAESYIANFEYEWHNAKPFTST